MREIKLAVLGAVVSLCMGASAPALQTSFSAFLDGPSEFPPNASPGTGSALVTYDDLAHTLRVQASFSGLLGTTTAAHIHAPTAVPLTGGASVATTTPFFPGFPLGVTSGTYDNTFDLTLASSFNGSFITANGGTPAGAEAALAQYLNEGRAYFNIHSSVFGGGEIRGFLTQVQVPDGGATLGLLSLGCVAAACARRRLLIKA